MTRYLSASILAVVLKSSSSPAAFALLQKTGGIARIAAPARPSPTQTTCASGPGEAPRD
jgi:hypothetical protein